MGALTDHRKRRSLDHHRSLLLFSSPDSPPSKKSKLFTSPDPSFTASDFASCQSHPAATTPAATTAAVASHRRFPPPPPANLRRPIHAPQRILKAFGIGSAVSSSNPSRSEADTRNLGLGLDSKCERGANSFPSSMSEKTGPSCSSRSVVEIGTGNLGLGFKSGRKRDASVLSNTSEMIKPSNPSRSAKEVNANMANVGLVLRSSSRPKRDVSISSLTIESSAKKAFGMELGFVEADKDNSVPSSRTEGSNENVNLGLEQYKDLVSSVLNLSEIRVLAKKVPLYKELYEQSVKSHESKLRELDFELKLAEKSAANFKLTREILGSKQKWEIPETFTPLTDEEEREVEHVLNGRNSQEVLVVHESSNIEITREILQCLRFGAWLNDEVINLYLDLLKERERREPQKFLKCHFFNTFFYKKLIGGSNRYDYRAVKRWTTQKKLGYSLIDCDRIFVPIHKEVHWCLVVINVRDKKLQYLDSLGSTDSHALRILARYFTEEVKDKSGKQIDALSWEQESFVPDLPLQENGWDCGVFMLKYIDFLSCDLNLSFSQDDMMYFRKRTAKEILNLRAD